MKYTKDEAISKIIESFENDNNPEVCARFKSEIERDYGIVFDTWQDAMAYEIADQFGIITEMVESNDPVGTLAKHEF